MQTHMHRPQSHFTLIEPVAFAEGDATGRQPVRRTCERRARAAFTLIEPVAFAEGDATGRQPVRRTCERHARAAFTLIELLVVIAIISVLAAMLLPALQAARKKAKIITCTAGLKQQGVAHAMYQDDSDGYFPLFGGPLDPTEPSGKNDGYGRPWILDTDVGNTYNTYYQTDIRLNYCPVVDFRTFTASPKAIFGPITFANTGVTNYASSNVVGYNFYTGRILGKKSGSTLEHDTIDRRSDGQEIIITDHVNKNTGSNNAVNSTGAMTTTAIPWLNPHDNRSCTPYPQGSFNQLLADNSVHQVSMTSPAFIIAFGYKGDTRSPCVGEIRNLGSNLKLYYYAYNGQ